MRRQDTMLYEVTDIYMCASSYRMLNGNCEQICTYNTRGPGLSPTIAKACACSVVCVCMCVCVCVFHTLSNELSILICSVCLCVLHILLRRSTVYMARLDRFALCQRNLVYKLYTGVK